MLNRVGLTSVTLLGTTIIYAAVYITIGDEFLEYIAIINQNGRMALRMTSLGSVCTLMVSTRGVEVWKEFGDNRFSLFTVSDDHQV